MCVRGAQGSNPASTDTEREEPRQDEMSLKTPIQQSEQNLSGGTLSVWTVEHVCREWRL